ncbi:MAG: hypothetical protein JOZ31_10605 [Verrucomicrobia bacterium]|nr:hypothetical protein [Verrucomicrobiota bacterium]MBV8482638.1 hypothetical protein [Verrucomicrobiota bacterium]
MIGDWWVQDIAQPWEFHRGKKRLSVNVMGRLIVKDALTYVALCVAGNGVAQLIDLTIEPLLKNGKLINLSRSGPTSCFRFMSIIRLGISFIFDFANRCLGFCPGGTR